MRRFDKYFLTLVYAPVLPILFFLAFWWGSLQIVSQNKIPLLALCGVATGIIADFFVLKRLIKNGYKQPAALLAAIYLFYSVGFFGFFMGVPVFNLIIGIFAGIFVARGAASAGEDEKSATARIAKVAWFATAVLAVVCAASAYFALSDSYTSANLSGMLGLNITSSAVNWIITVGGVALLAAQYWLTRFAGAKTLKKFGA